jgi:hypothetical protein
MMPNQSIQEWMESYFVPFAKDFEHRIEQRDVRIAELEAALHRIIQNRVEDGGPCDGDVSVCDCSECIARAALKPKEDSKDE